MLRNSMDIAQAGHDLMSNTPIIVKSVRDRFLEVATEAERLAEGLQSVAPADHTASSNMTVQYLFGVSDQLHAYAKECELLLK